MRYLNPRLSYYNFRFVKTDVRHIGILLPVSILIVMGIGPWPILHRRIKFDQNRPTHGGVMTLYRFFKMAAGSHVGFRVGNSRNPRSATAAWSTNLESIGFIISEILPN